MVSSLKPEQIFNFGSPRLDILKKEKDDLLEYYENNNFNAIVSASG